MGISVRLNGREGEGDIRPNETLADGPPTSSCLMLATNAEGRSVTTVEGLAEDGQLSEIQRAFVECQAFQCGYCTSGVLMACAALLAEVASPSDAGSRAH